MEDPDVAAYHLWARDDNPGSVDGAVAYVVDAQMAHNIGVIRQLLEQALTKKE